MTLVASSAGASVPGADTRLTNDSTAAGGYVSADDLAGLPHYSDATLDECSRSRGRQNEPSVAVDPRNPQVVVGSSNDYCAVYNDADDADGAPIPSGPIWLGYYRSENGGTSFTSSLLPGYPGDNSALGRLSGVRTASAGDPVLAWDTQGRLFAGSESSDDPAGSKKSFGDVFVARYRNSGGGFANDGKRFAGSTIVARGSSAPNLLGVFNDKTAIEVDRTSGSCAGTVYFSYSRFTGNGGVALYLARSTDHGVTFSAPIKITAGVHDVQGPDISVTGNGHVYITFRQFTDGHLQPDAIDLVRSTNCGATFSAPRVLAKITPFEAVDRLVSGGSARDCGDGASACQSGYTFFRTGTLPRSTADQATAANEWVHVAYEATVPGSVVSTGSTYGSTNISGQGGQGSIYYLRYNGATGQVAAAPRQVAPEPVFGHQLFPDIVVDAGTLHAIWWDSRNDVMNNASTFRQRPMGDDADGNVGPALDVFGSTKSAGATTWTMAAPVSDVTSNPNYEQFGGRTVPFAGDYLWVDSRGGNTVAVWTDWRNTVPGVDQRETTPDESGADVLQCRTVRTDGSFTGDKCPRLGGLDQNIYGDRSP
ncbi:MAG: hypothetical protein DLM58_21060 [Pseudonocardiales bacterium]|nr:MAG: hypothetical protein DLM58_21060 [Pseudonocardiales bacterium]